MSYERGLSCCSGGAALLSCLAAQFKRSCKIAIMQRWHKVRALPYACSLQWRGPNGLVLPLHKVRALLHIRNTPYLELSHDGNIATMFHEKRKIIRLGHGYGLVERKHPNNCQR